MQVKRIQSVIYRKILENMQCHLSVYVICFFVANYFCFIIFISFSDIARKLRRWTSEQSEKQRTVRNEQERVWVSHVQWDTGVVAGSRSVVAEQDSTSVERHDDDQQLQRVDLERRHRGAWDYNAQRTVPWNKIILANRQQLTNYYEKTNTTTTV